MIEKKDVKKRRESDCYDNKSEMIIKIWIRIYFKWLSKAKSKMVIIILDDDEVAVVKWNTERHHERTCYLCIHL